MSYEHHKNLLTHILAKDTKISINEINLVFELSFFDNDINCSFCEQDLFIYRSDNYSSSEDISNKTNIDSHDVIHNICGHHFHSSCASLCNMICNRDKKPINNENKTTISIQIQK